MTSFVTINNTCDYTPSFCIETWVNRVFSVLNVGFDHLEITLLSPEKIQVINREYFQNDCSTDTISFNLDENINNHFIKTGDIYICPFQIIQNAEEWNTTIDKEFKIVIIHSILHLIGYSDTTPDSAFAMQQQQATIYSKIINES